MALSVKYAVHLGQRTQDHDWVLRRVRGTLLRVGILVPVVAMSLASTFLLMAFGDAPQVKLGRFDCADAATGIFTRLVTVLSTALLVFIPLILYGANR